MAPNSWNILIRSLKTYTTFTGTPTPELPRWTPTVNGSIAPSKRSTSTTTSPNSSTQLSSTLASWNICSGTIPNDLTLDSSYKHPFNSLLLISQRSAICTWLIHTLDSWPLLCYSTSEIWSSLDCESSSLVWRCNSSRVIFYFYLFFYSQSNFYNFAAY